MNIYWFWLGSNYLLNCMLSINVKLPDLASTLINLSQVCSTESPMVLVVREAFTCLYISSVIVLLQDAFITSCLYFCTSLQHGIINRLMQKLQLVQKYCSRVNTEMQLHHASATRVTQAACSSRIKLEVAYFQ